VLALEGTDAIRGISSRGVGLRRIGSPRGKAESAGRLRTTSAELLDVRCMHNAVVYRATRGIVISADADECTLHSVESPRGTGSRHRQ
jgi:hypothetical protein